MKNLKLECGIIGLGKMGGGLALQAIEKGIRVVGLDLSGVPQKLSDAGVIAATEYAKLAELLAPPRKIFLYVPAGQVVDMVIQGLATFLAPGDVIVDGGNSYWGDSIQRAKELERRGIYYVDMGTSGGPAGARSGACFMVGAEQDEFDALKPLLEPLAVEGGLIHAGPVGAGHFVKLVHNGIEFGMMQALGEGLDLLQNYKDPLDISSILEGWRHGTVIRSWLLDLLSSAYSDPDHLRSIDGAVEDTGEVNWLIGDAAQMEISIPVIAQAVWKLIDSRDDQKIWAKAIAAMRHGFGGHPYGRSPALEKYRHSSRRPRIAPEVEPPTV